MDTSTATRRTRRNGQGKGARAISSELKMQIRRRPAKAERALVWSIPVGSVPDTELDEVLAILARIGVHGSYERELGFIAHFLVAW